MQRWLRKIDGLAELYQLLQQIERTRILQQRCAHAVDQLLRERDLALYECYRMFRRNGGVTVSDFDSLSATLFRLPRAGRARVEAWIIAAGRKQPGKV
jgi:hypothetical protein